MLSSEKRSRWGTEAVDDQNLTPVEELEARSFANQEREEVAELEERRRDGDADFLIATPLTGDNLTQTSPLPSAIIPDEAVEADDRDEDERV